MKRVEAPELLAADRTLETLALTFERWLEIGSDKQPHYPNGLRPWSNGDLRFLIDGINDARADRVRNPDDQIAGLVSALEQGARWFEEYAVDQAVKARQAPSYAEQGAREDKAKRNQERAEFLRNAATFRGEN